MVPYNKHRRERQPNMMVPVQKELHGRVKALAAEKGMQLKAWVQQAIVAKMVHDALDEAERAKTKK